MMADSFDRFDEDDKFLLTNMIQRAFRSQRMGNLSDRDTQIRLVATYYGDSTARCLRKSLREDRRYTLEHSITSVGA